MVLKVKTVVTLAVGSDQKGAVGRFWGCWLCLDRSSSQSMSSVCDVDKKGFDVLGTEK